MFYNFFLPDSMLRTRLWRVIWVSRPSVIWGNFESLCHRLVLVCLHSLSFCYACYAFVSFTMLMMSQTRLFLLVSTLCCLNAFSVFCCFCYIFCYAFCAFVMLRLCFLLCFLLCYSLRWFLYYLNVYGWTCWCNLSQCLIFCELLYSQWTMMPFSAE